MDFFKVYKWPGNVRELEHAIEGAMNITDAEIIEISADFPIISLKCIEEIPACHRNAKQNH